MCTDGSIDKRLEICCREVFKATNVCAWRLSNTAAFDGLISSQRPLGSSGWGLTLRDDMYHAIQ